MNRGRLSGTFPRKAGIYTVIGSKTQQNKKDFHIKKILYIAFHNPIKTHSVALSRCTLLISGRGESTEQQDARRKNSYRTSNVTQHFQVTMVCHTGHMMQVRLNISFYICGKIKKIRSLNLEKAKSLAGLESIYKTWQRKTLFTATICFLAHWGNFY